MKKYIAVALLTATLLLSIHSFTRTGENNAAAKPKPITGQKLKSYQIAVGDSYANLEVKVNHAMAQGWQPEGGIFIEHLDSIRRDFIQVLVR